MSRMAETVAGDGYRLRYRVWEPAGPVRAQAVLLNGIMSHAGWFQPLAPALLRAGVRLVGADRRGSAENTLGRGDAPSAAVLVADVQEILAAEVRPGVPLMLVGWCWGAALAVAVAQKLGASLRGLVLITPGFFPTEKVKRALERQRDHILALRHEEAAVESPILESYFTTGPALDDFILRDDMRLRAFSPRLLEISRKLNASAIARLPKLALPLLVVLAAHEDATDNEATSALVERVATSQTIVLPTRHGVQFEAADELAAAILSWWESLPGGC